MKWKDRWVNMDTNNKYYEALTNVIDPELDIDIVNLGLIYGIELKSNVAVVTMTLTTMGCPLSNYLFEEIQKQLIGFPEIDDIDINLVWTPRWSIKKMSRVARMQLGIH